MGVPGLNGIAIWLIVFLTGSRNRHEIGAVLVDAINEALAFIVDSGTG